MSHDQVVVLAACAVLSLLVMEYFLIKGGRDHLILSQEKEWADTQQVIRDTLGDPARQQVIEDIEARSAPNGTFLKQVCVSTATALQAPAAVITVVEWEGQKWLAYHGADWCSEEMRSGLLQPLATSYCQNVVASDTTMVVNDALRDIRLKGNDPRTKGVVRAYLGAPVHTVDGMVVGSLCVFDKKPRKWSTRDRTVVESFASLVWL